MNAHPFSQHWPLLLLSAALIASLALAGLLRTSAAGDTPGKQETPPKPPAGPAVVSTDSILNNSPEEDDYLEEIQGVILAANYAEARRACDSMLLEFQEKYGKESIPAAKVWHLLGVIKSGESQLDSSLVFYQRALRIREKAYLGNPHPDLGMTYNNIGIIYAKNGQYRQALSFFLKGLEVNKAVLGEEDLKIGFAYANLGRLYDLSGEYEKALGYLKEAEALIQAKTGPDSPKLAHVYNNMGIVYRKIGQVERAFPYLEKALELKKTAFGDTHPEVAAGYNNLGLAYLDRGDTGKAISNLEKNLSILTAIFGDNHLYVASSAHNVGDVLAEQGLYARAIPHYERALRIRERLLGAFHPDLGLNLIMLGTIAEERKEFEKALDYYDQALYRLRFQPGSEEGFSSVNAPLHMIDALYYKARIHTRFFRQGRGPEHLILARQEHDTIQAAIDYLRASYTEESSVQFFNQNTAPLFEAAISNALLLHENGIGKGMQEKSFQLSEAARSYLLQAAFRKSDALHYVGVADTLVEREKNLQQAIAQAEKERHEAAGSPQASDSLLQAYTSGIFSLRQEYEALKQHFKTQYPDYFRLRYDNSTLSPKGVQDSLLAPGQALVEYFVGDSSLFAFVIRKDTFLARQIPLDFPLEDWARQMQKSLFEFYLLDRALQSEDKRQAAARQYAEAAHQLYLHVFEPVDELLPPGTDITIIPDGVLGYLPFEVFLVEKPEKADGFRTHHYLLKDRRISYAYSATALAEMKYRRAQRSPEKTLLAFAPSFTQDSAALASRDPGPTLIRNRLGPLKWNAPEAASIQKIMGGALFTGALATKGRFTELSGNFKILHLSTHGKANDQVGDYSFLAFYEASGQAGAGRLYTRELYNLSLDAEMVVLSACETGIGELQRGEGIISLARGFSYAGAKSIITSLWSVNDKATMEVMELFYRHIKAGKAKDEALRLAKLEYLANSVNAAPFYWAGFIPIGDMAPITLQPWWKPLWIWGLNGAALLLLGWLFLRRRPE